MGTGLSAIRKTNRCNAQCKFCYDYGQLDAIEPIGEGLWETGGTKYYERDLPCCFPSIKSPRGFPTCTWSLSWRLKNITG